MPVWIIAISSDEHICQQLQFSYGVLPVYEDSGAEDWDQYARDWLVDHGMNTGAGVLTQGPVSIHKEGMNRINIFTLDCCSD